MTFLKQTFFILMLLLVFSCNKKDSETVGVGETKIAKTSEIKASDEKEKLQVLTRQLYKWHETKSSNDDFNPVADTKDSIYTSLNLKEHTQRLKELKETGFFSKNFLENYDKIGLKIDSGLKNGKLEWAIGELPPFGNDSNPWCNCQDNPENYWEILAIKKIKIEGNIANLTWTWGDNFEYKVRAQKDNDTWKIDYLEGFDFNNFF